MPKIEKVKLASLIRDFNLYPRTKIVAFNVTSIKRSLEAGFSIPPIVADRKTRLVTDGFNRCQAVENLYGAEAEIEVEWRDYENRAAMFEDAMLLNSTHGEKLTPLDQAHCIQLATQLRIQKDRLAACLHAKPEFIDSLKHRKIAMGADGPILVRGTFARFAKDQNDRREAGESPAPFSRKQTDAIEGCTTSLPWWFLLDATIRLFKGGGVPLNNEKAIPRIQELADLTAKAVQKLEKMSA